MRTERKLRAWNLALVEIQGCRVAPCYYLPLSSCVCLERCCTVSSGKHSVLFICFHVQICLCGEKRREALCKLNLCCWAEERLQTHGVWVFLPPGTYGCLLPQGCSGHAPVRRLREVGALRVRLLSAVGDLEGWAGSSALGDAGAQPGKAPTAAALWKAGTT